MATVLYIAIGTLKASEHRQNTPITTPFAPQITRFIH